MLTLNIEGAQVLLALLNHIATGNVPTESESQALCAANHFFLDFYSRWQGMTQENLIEAIHRFNQPDYSPATPVLAALTRGFQRAVAENERLQANLNFLRTVNPSAIMARVQPYLPPDTPLQSTIHITIDGFNGGFQYQGQMGWSLLNDISTPGQFEAGIAHELHHVGFACWVERDPIRQTLLREKSARAIAVHHVQNLLSEGLAMFYCSPETLNEAHASAAYARKLAQYRQEESQWFAQAEQVLRASLEADADFDACRRALTTLALDLDGMLPAGHYLGARMIETMSRHHPQEQIVECVRALTCFLPLYNQAARAAGVFVYAPAAVEQFSRLLEPPVTTI